MFVVCLAVSDLALCIFSLPIQLHYQLTDNWNFGSTLCRIVFAAFAVPMYLSTVTIMLIAIDRCDKNSIYDYLPINVQYICVYSPACPCSLVITATGSGFSFRSGQSVCML